MWSYQLLYPLFLFGCVPGAMAFTLVIPSHSSSNGRTLVSLSATMSSRGSSSSSSSYGNRRAAGGGNYGSDERSKRQERVGQLVLTELSQILHRGSVSRAAEYLDDDLRQRISIVRADVSPDLRQARISVSMMTTTTSTSDDGDKDAAADKRRAYAWLVRNNKALRHALAQRMSHLKTCPELTFVQVDVSAAVDVMYLIDKVASGQAKRTGSLIDEKEVVGPSGVMGGIDFDEEFDEEEWEEDDDDDFFLPADKRAKKP